MASSSTEVAQGVSALEKRFHALIETIGEEQPRSDSTLRLAAIYNQEESIKPVFTQTVQEIGKTLQAHLASVRQPWNPEFVLKTVRQLVRMNMLAVYLNDKALEKSIRAIITRFKFELPTMVKKCQSSLTPELVSEEIIQQCLSLRLVAQIIYPGEREVLAAVEELISIAHTATLKWSSDVCLSIGYAEFQRHYFINHNNIQKLMSAYDLIVLFDDKVTLSQINAGRLDATESIHQLIDRHEVQQALPSIEKFNELERLEELSLILREEDLVIRVSSLKNSVLEPLVKRFEDNFMPSKLIDLITLKNWEEILEFSQLIGRMDLAERIGLLKNEAKNALVRRVEFFQEKLKSNEQPSMEDFNELKRLMDLSQSFEDKELEIQIDFLQYSFLEPLVLSFEENFSSSELTHIETLRNWQEIKEYAEQIRETKLVERIKALQHHAKAVVTAHIAESTPSRSSESSENSDGSEHLGSAECFVENSENLENVKIEHWHSLRQRVRFFKDSELTENFNKLEKPRRGVKFNQTVSLGRFFSGSAVITSCDERGLKESVPNIPRPGSSNGDY
jgi:hypothetical protein